MKVQLLLTGSELMSGDTVDSNSAMIAQALAPLGLSISRKVTVGDQLDQLVGELQDISSKAELLIVNGGLGPTVDDRSAEALGLLLQSPLVSHPQARQHIEDWCRQRGTEANAANLKQCLLPGEVDIIPNPIGSAVGFSISHQQCLIMFTPGVPGELRAMLEQSIIPTLAGLQAGESGFHISRYKTFGLGESGLQQWIADDFGPWPAQIELGFRAGAPLVEVKLISQGDQHRQLHAETERRLLKLLGSYIIGRDNCTLADIVVADLKLRGQKLSCAESCTGGLIASMLTEVPGCSEVFSAGFVTYSNQAKQDMLGVSENTLARHGAVSLQVVEEMVEGALQRSGADYAVAVSGIAGPGGGSESKPVGCVCIAWGKRQHIQSRMLRFTYNNRKLFQLMVSATALDLIRRDINELRDEPRYLLERAFYGVE